MKAQEFLSLFGGNDPGYMFLPHAEEYPDLSKDITELQEIPVVSFNIKEIKNRYEEYLVEFGEEGDEPLPEWETIVLHLVGASLTTVRDAHEDYGQVSVLVFSDNSALTYAWNGMTDSGECVAGDTVQEAVKKLMDRGEE